MPRLDGRIEVSGTIRFKSAFHLGTGEGGRAGTDKGALVGADGTPLLPGSSVKGVFRSTAERLAHLLGLTACLLEPES